jgi:hypothetical protein
MSQDPEKDIIKFSTKSFGRVLSLKRAVAVKLFSAVIKDSPVGNPDLWKINEGKNGDDDGSNNIIAPEGYVGGRLRANWNTSIGNPDISTSESVDFAATLRKIPEAVKAGTLETDIYLSNSLPYAERIEYDGHSSQAPAGMLRRNVARFRLLIQAELRKLKTS